MAKVNSFVFIDFETGGLDCNKSAITEVAMVAIKGDTLETIAEMNEFVKPYDDTLEYSDAALKATGITWQEIESGLDIKEVSEKMLEVLRAANLYNSAQYKPVLCAHNSPFDKGFFLQIMSRTKKLKEILKLTYGDTDFYGNYQPEFLDSITVAKMVWGDDELMTQYKLGACISKAGLDLADGHRAINDTRGLRDLMVSFIQNLRSGMGESEAKKGTRIRDHFNF